MNYFSDRYENNEYVSNNVWNGIVSLYEKLIGSNIFAKDFPENCPDNNMPYAVNKKNLETAIKANIPLIEIPIKIIENEPYANFFENDSKNNKILLSTAFDLIEFMFKHLSNPKKVGKFHNFFNHYHLDFSDDLNEIRSYFIDEINIILTRNNLNYKINKNGFIERTYNNFEEPLIPKKEFYTKDDELNELLNRAYEKFRSRNKKEKREALDILWDAFERLKTKYGANKKTKNSIEKIINEACFDKKIFKTAVEKDAEQLNNIGNKLNIRHKNTEVEEISYEIHINYLFFRMSNLILLLLNESRETK